MPVAMHISFSVSRAGKTLLHTVGDTTMPLVPFTSVPGPASETQWYSVLMAYGFKSSGTTDDGSGLTKRSLI